MPHVQITEPQLKNKLLSSALCSKLNQMFLDMHSVKKDNWNSIKDGLVVFLVDQFLILQEFMEAKEIGKIHSIEISRVLTLTKSMGEVITSLREFNNMRKIQVGSLTFIF